MTRKERIMSEDGLMFKAVKFAFKNAKILPSDYGAAQLMFKYARLLDKALDADNEAEIYNDLGPKLLAVLTALGMTPAARGAKGGGQGGDVANKLDELRARREKRAG
jgi:hypothetical protein